LKPINYVLFVISRAAPSGRRVAEPPMVEMPGEPMLHQAQNDARFLPLNYQHIISIEPGKRGGRPCIRHVRIAVADVLGWLAAGQTYQQSLDDFPN